jgi:hypothetical protein
MARSQSRQRRFRQHIGRIAGRSLYVRICFRWAICSTAGGQGPYTLDRVLTRVPNDIKVLYLALGQRYSVMIKLDQSPGNYFLRFATYPAGDMQQVLEDQAIISYSVSFISYVIAITKCLLST